MDNILTTQQAATLYYIARFSEKNGGLLPWPMELAKLTSTNEIETARQMAELRDRGFFIIGHGLSSFNTLAAAMYPSEAAVIIVAHDLGREWGRPWITKEEIHNAVSLRCQRTREWRINDLLESAVRMGYLISHGNGTYECAPKIVAHLAYLKFLLRPPRPSPARRKT